MLKSPGRIAVVGLGYVGLPLAVALAKRFPVVGFDVDARRIAELAGGRDRTGEVAPETLAASPLRFSADESDLDGVDCFIVAVPTPVDRTNKPDLGLVRQASATVGRHLSPGGLVVFESTVYPGVTEEICGPILAEASGLTCGQEFFLGYSPERINPGDREHTIDRITKVIAGQNQAVTELMAEIYGSVTSGGVFRAADIKTAEAAKVIENAQRDVNIAFINEITMIFNKMDISVHDVLEAARSKWNFLGFAPGLVGGHCIGVDPYYLAHRAAELGHRPEVILAGRRINDGMGSYFAERIAEQLDGSSRILVLGLTFKENVPDLRNTKVADLVAALRGAGHLPEVHDPLADPGEAKALYGIDLHRELDGLGGYDALVGAVPHAQYRDLDAEDFRRLITPGGLLADLKGMWRDWPLPGGLRRWTV
ncbi:MAG: nucleotide sugar dehydrogenase [Kiloniellales bacterium]|nr:nucleotide sugar dehydrogenase [Kiloniellales bacterium]